MLLENKLWYKTIEQFLNYLESLKDNTFVFIDTETTGLKGPKNEQLTQISAISINPNNYNNIDKFNQKIKLTDDIKKILDVPTGNGWNRRRVLSFNKYGEKIKNQKYLDEEQVLNMFHQWLNKLKNPLLVIQNAEFDMAMLNGRNLKKLKYPVLDTKQIIQLYMIPLYQKLAETNDLYKEKLNKIGTSPRDNGLTSSSMSKWAPEFGINTSGYHDALFDCEMTIEMYKNMIILLNKYKNLDISKYQIERIKSLRNK